MKNIFRKVLNSLPLVINVLVISIIATLSLYLVYTAGYKLGYNSGSVDTAKQIETISKGAKVSSIDPEAAPQATPQVIIIEPTFPPAVAIPNWSGPELWEAVNKRRQELGVNSMSNQGELCTIASIRLNELLDRGELDGHEGFSTLPERRPDLKWIFEKYNISEFLVSGAESASEAVELWENTLGHKKLLTGGEYVWGCTYAQNSFGVAIAAY